MYLALVLTAFIFTRCECVNRTSCGQGPKSAECLHGGQCVAGRCVCREPYTGAACNISDIQHRNTTGATTATWNTTRGAARGTATPLTLKHMTLRSHVAACLSNPCLHNSTCFEIGYAYGCVCAEEGFDPKYRCHVCADGYYGHECRQKCSSKCAEGFCDYRRGCSKCMDGWSKPPRCDSVNCLSQDVTESHCSPGKCIDNRCVCPVGWSGLDCSVRMNLERLPKCPNKTCVDGKCIVLNNDEVCVCKVGYVLFKNNRTCLKRCRDFSNSCVHGTCEENPLLSKIMCECAYGYGGTYCERKCATEWGPKCLYPCGFCKVLPCHSSFGHCNSQGCISSAFQPPDCTKVIDGPSGFPYDRQHKVMYARVKTKWVGRFVVSLRHLGSRERGQLNRATNRLIQLSCRHIDVINCSSEILFVWPGSVNVELLVNVNSQQPRSLDLKNQLPRAMKTVAPLVKHERGFALVLSSAVVTQVLGGESATLTTHKRKSFSPLVLTVIVSSGFLACVIILVTVCRRRMLKSRARTVNVAFVPGRFRSRETERRTMKQPRYLARVGR